MATCDDETRKRNEIRAQRCRRNPIDAAGLGVRSKQKPGDDQDRSECKTGRDVKDVRS
jgi:hypothetical protein